MKEYFHFFPICPWNMISIVASIIVNIWSYFMNVSLYITFKLSKVYFRAVLILFCTQHPIMYIKVILIEKKSIY